MPEKVAPAPLSLIKAHDVALGDLSFSPFHDDVLATAGADACLRLWKLPSDIKELSTYTTANAIFTATLDSPVQSLVWHPTVAGVVTSTTHENSVYMHSLEGKQMVRRNVACESSSSINNASYDPVGSLLALGCRDNAIRIIDPRSPSSGDLRTPESTKVGRNLRVAWCSDSAGGAECLLSVSAQGTNRHVETWDPRKLDSPLSSLHVDSAAGQLYPYYDQGMQTAFVVGRGDTTLRTYELKFDNSVVTVAKSSEYNTTMAGQTWAGMAMLPKTTCNIASVQCARMLKLSSGNMIVPLSFVLPRSDAQKGLFQDEIFPDIPTNRADEARSTADFAAYLAERRP